MIGKVTINVLLIILLIIGLSRNSKGSLCLFVLLLFFIFCVLKIYFIYLKLCISRCIGIDHNMDFKCALSWLNRIYK